MAPVRSVLIRLGLSAVGAIYVAMGVVSARVALLGARDREDGVPGALRFLLEQPHGARILGAVVAGLAGIALVHVIEAATGRRPAFVRAGLAANAVAYGSLAWTAARLLFHIGRGGGSLERTGVSWLLGQVWGATLLEIVGATVVAGGLWEAYQGLRGRLSFSRRLLPRGFTRWLVWIARFGQITRGLVLTVLGYFLIRAAEELDPGRVRSVGGVLHAFSQTAMGPIFDANVASRNPPLPSLRKNGNVSPASAVNKMSGRPSLSASRKSTPMLATGFPLSSKAQPASSAVSSNLPLPLFRNKKFGRLSFVTYASISPSPS